MRVLVAGGNTTTQAARQATDRVPIVSVNGLGTRWRRGPWPAWRGRAATSRASRERERGLHQDRRTARGDRARGRRLAYMGNLSGSASPHGEVAAAAAQRGLELLVLDVPTQAEIEPAFEQAVAWGAQLLVAQSVIPLNANPRQLPELALRARLPAAAAGGRGSTPASCCRYSFDTAAAAHRSGLVRRAHSGGRRARRAALRAVHRLTLTINRPR